MTGPGALQALRADGWEEIPGLVHGFCGRHGGRSRGPFAELNLSARVGDEPAVVHANWETLRAALPGLSVATARQVHGADVVDEGAVGAEEPEADALVTRRDGRAVGVLTADCVPLLLVAPSRRVAAAVHAGWRGTLAGVAVRAVEYLRARHGVEPAEIRAALGPAIGACCYEVDAAVADGLEGEWGPMREAVRRATPGSARAAKAYVDLRGVNGAQLLRSGVPAKAIGHVGPCTRCSAADYFSYRAAAGGVTGRQLSFVGWRS